MKILFILFLNLLVLAYCQQGCEVSVIGSGWGGIYYAWRLAIDESVVNPNTLCIFEAEPLRYGGRSYNYTDETLSGLVLDFCAYRFSAEHELISNLIIKRLNIKVACYEEDDEVSGQCKYYVISDPYGNNGGYIKGIDAMLIPLLESGARLFLDHELVGVYEAKNNNQNTLLRFKNGLEIESGKVLLNIPNSAVKRLQPDSLLFTEGSQRLLNLFQNTVETESLKIFLYYQDAWWVNSLNNTQGKFSSSINPPLRGNYHSGPIKCNRFGRSCSGALQVYYGNNGDEYSYYYKYFDMNKIYVVWDQFTYLDALKDVHQALMEVHRQEFLDLGIDPQTIALPEKGYISLWKARDNIYNLVGWEVPSSLNVKEIVSKPLPNRNIYMANQAYTSQPWAEFTLQLVEYILQNHHGVPPPKWV